MVTVHPSVFYCLAFLQLNSREARKQTRPGVVYAAWHFCSLAAAEQKIHVPRCFLLLRVISVAQQPQSKNKRAPVLFSPAWPSCSLAAAERKHERAPVCFLAAWHFCSLAAAKQKPERPGLLLLHGISAA